MYLSIKLAVPPTLARCFQYFFCQFFYGHFSIFDFFGRCDIEQYKVGGGQNKYVSKKTFFYLPGVSSVTCSVLFPFAHFLTS